MKAFYSDEFVLPLPPGHRFPMRKYRMLRDRVQSELPGVQLMLPHAASDGVLALAHCPDYIDRVQRGCLTPQEQRDIGFPWSPAMVERSRRSTGATIDACRAALAEGRAVNLAGGTHHAHADRGEGFCVFNDAAVAARLMQAECGRQGKSLQVLIVDLDVHQGNGTATILQNDPTVFTFSMHGSNNFPFKKANSDLDIALEDGTQDAQYLDVLTHALNRIRTRFNPGLVIYVAGVDCHEGDRLGKLKLTDEGIAQRDRCVLDFCKACGVPVAATMAGGYANALEHMVELQLGIVRRLYESR